MLSRSESQWQRLPRALCQRYPAQASPWRLCGSEKIRPWTHKTVRTSRTATQSRVVSSSSLTFLWFLALTCWEFSTDLSSDTTYRANQNEISILNKHFSKWVTNDAIEEVIAVPRDRQRWVQLDYEMLMTQWSATTPCFCFSVTLIIDWLSSLHCFHEPLVRLPSTDAPGARSRYNDSESHWKKASGTGIHKRCRPESLFISALLWESIAICPLTWKSPSMNLLGSDSVSPESPHFSVRAESHTSTVCVFATSKVGLNANETRQNENKATQLPKLSASHNTTAPNADWTH